MKWISFGALSRMEDEKKHFQRKWSDVYGEDVLTERQCQNWFAKFHCGNFNLVDTPRPGKPPSVDANRRITTREIAEWLNLSNATVHKHMERLGLISKLNIWDPHVLTERNLLRRINDCDTLIRRQRNDPFLKRIITGYEKWVVNNNIKRKRSWSKKDEPAQTTLKPDMQQKKLCCPFGAISRGSFILSFCRCEFWSLLQSAGQLRWCTQRKGTRIGQ